MGMNQGYQDPNAKGMKQGNQDPNAKGMNQEYQDPNIMGMNQGYQDPNAMGMNQGYQDPNMMGMNQGYQDPNMMGMDQGYQDPNMMGMNQGYQDSTMEYQGGQSSDDEEGFVQSWMGALYNKAQTKKFNWCAAFFGPCYLLFRKIFSTGILVLILQVALMVICGLIEKNNVALGLGILTAVDLILFFGLGFGFYPLYKAFIKSQYKKLSLQITDSNQLMAAASKKGGTTPLGIVIYCIVMAIVIPVMAVTGLNLGVKKDNKDNTNQVANVVEEPTEEEFNFYEDYAIKYDPNNWFFDEEAKTLTKEDYTLEYKVAYKASDLNMDMSSLEGLSNLLKLLSDSFTAQAAQSNLQVEVGSKNFISSNGNYYAYIDISDSTSITRYYFVVIPDDEILLQFVLSADDTSVDYEVNVETIEMITNISKASKTENSDEDDEENENENQVSDDEEETNTTSNKTSNSTTNSTRSANETNTTKNTTKNTTSNTTKTNTTSNSTRSNTNTLNSIIND